MPDTTTVIDDEFEEIPLGDSISSPGFFAKGTKSMVPIPSADLGIDNKDKKKKPGSDRAMCCNLL